ncbi:MAG: hypothetical protein IPN06_12535 [Burkholderiales bacterium]|nr:hypothetical protein [Burkholderiales bacterium]
MQTTAYFRDDVMLKRPYIRTEWVELALSNPVRKEVQAEDGRIRQWVWIEDLQRYLRVVTLEDGITVPNAFADRRFKP